MPTARKAAMVLMLTALIVICFGVGGALAGNHMEIFNSLTVEERCKRMGGMYLWGTQARNQGAGRGVIDTSKLKDNAQFLDHVWVQNYDKLDADFQELMAGMIDLGWVAVDDILEADRKQLEQQHIEQGRSEWVGKINPAPLYQHQIGGLIQEFYDTCMLQMDKAKRRI